MVKVFPDGWRELTATDAAERELQTLAQLAAGLDDNYSVYHGVHWTQVERGTYAIFGEIDFAIVGPTGKILLIEQKAGLLYETPGGLTKKYLEKEKNVSSQMARSADALHRRLRKVCGDQATFVDSLLYCPDYTVKEPGTAGIDPARIVDAAKKDYLMHIIRTILPGSGEVLQLVPQADAVVGAAQTLTDGQCISRRLARTHGHGRCRAASCRRSTRGSRATLAHWARRSECEPFRLRVTATAGSGNTQLGKRPCNCAILNSFDVFACVSGEA